MNRNAFRNMVRTVLLCGSVIVTGDRIAAARSNEHPCRVSNLLAPATPVYRVTLWRNGDPMQAVVLEGGLQDLDSGGRNHHAEAIVRIARQTVGKSTHWHIQVEPRETFGVYEVEFPIVELKPIAPESRHERLLVSFNHGIVIDDPLHCRPANHHAAPRRKMAVWFASYPSYKQAMQLMIYDDGSDTGRGLMFWTPDPDSYVKDFHVRPPKGAAASVRTRVFSVSHFPDDTGQPGTEWRSPYPVVMTPLDNGWYSGTQIYRQWALKQRWCAAGPIIDRLSQQELPPWYARNAAWAVASNYKYSHGMLEGIRTMFPEGEIGVFVTGWMKFRFDYHYPDYLPPKDPKGYRELMAMQRDGLHMFPYMNANVADGQYEPNAELIESDWFIEWPYAKQQLARRLRKNGGGDPKLIDTIRIKRKFRVMCRAASAWQDRFVGLVCENFETYEPHGHYLDQLDPAGVYPCFSKDHGHPVGFGRTNASGTRELLTRICQRHPDRVLFAEHFSEVTTDLVQEHYVVGSQMLTHDFVPLTSSVYQGYTCFHEWPINEKMVKQVEDFASAVALVVHLGEKIGSFQTFAPWLELMKPENEASRRFLQVSVAMSLRTMETRPTTVKTNQTEHAKSVPLRVPNRNRHQPRYHWRKRHEVPQNENSHGTASCIDRLPVFHACGKRRGRFTLEASFRRQDTR